MEFENNKVLLILILPFSIVWKFCHFDLVCFFTSHSTTMVMSVGTVSSPNHTFSWAILTKQLTSTLCTYFSLVTDNSPSWISGREENGHRNYFMINLHESMGPGRDGTSNPCQLFKSAAFYVKCTSDYFWSWKPTHTINLKLLLKGRSRLWKEKLATYSHTISS